MDDFTHLHVHSEFSFLDGFIRVWDDAAKKPGIFIQRLKDIGQKSIAITDHGSTAGWVRWHKACTKNDIVPIMGVEGYYCDDITVRGLPEDLKIKAIRGLKSKKEQNAAVKKTERKLGLAKRAHFTCWAMNEEGLYEILKSMSIASVDGFYYRPRWDFNMIKNMKNCLFGTACPGGILNYYLNYEVEVLGKKVDKAVFDTAGEKAIIELGKWKKELGDRLYVEIQALDWNKVQSYTLFSLMVANKLKIPVYMSNDCHYVNREDNETHDILLALGAAYKSTNKDVLNDPNRLRYDMKDLFIKSRKEMFDSFRKWHKRVDIYSDEKINSWLDKTVEIGERCHHGINKKNMIMPNLVLPDFPRPNKCKDEQKDYLLYLVNEGWKRKIIPYVKKENWPKYKEQLQYELKEIMRQGFTPYFILVNDLMRWVDQQGIARGPARGSSAGSLVAYLCDITMIDPIPHKLLFSRFIDPNRSDFPDVDMDFEDWRRREIITYFVDKYGIDNVSALGNNMLYKPKFALKDVARLYNVPLWEVNKLTNLVVERSGADSRLSFCLFDTFKQFEFAKDFAKKYPEVVRHAINLEGRVSRTGTHAAGVVIADGDIRKYSALRRDNKNPDLLVSTIDKHDAESIGLLKMDVLGLNTMAIIQEAKRLIKSNYNVDVGLEEMCRDVTYNGGDKKVYKEFAVGHTVGIFQFTTPGLTRLAMQVKIEKFSEISDCTALHRPSGIHSGSMAQYPALKSGKLGIEKTHPIVDNIIGETYGLPIYQEQVMRIVRELGNFDWAQTNDIRKVMSKSAGAEYFMTTYWPSFKEGAATHGVDEELALKVFKKIMTFGSWGFNLAHSVSYAFVSYMCMWLKVYYPTEFIVAYLNKLSEGEGYEDKIKGMLREAHRLGIEVIEPDINLSKIDFKIVDGKIVSGLYNIKNVGIKAIENIVENQPYDSILDFLKRIDFKKCNKRAIQNLFLAGVFRRFKPDVGKVVENIELLLKEAKKRTEKGYTGLDLRLKECIGGNQTEQEILQQKLKVSPISVGRHISTFYNDVTDRLSSHIKVTKLIDVEMDESVQKMDFSKERDFNAIHRLEVNFVGLMGKPDLKRLSQESKEVIDSGMEKRYALANLEDDTDFIVLSFKEGVYTRYEQQLFDLENKVVLVQGVVNKGWKKCFVDRLFIMDDLRKYLNDGKKPFNFDYDYLFEHPLHRIFNKYGGIDVIRKKYGCKPLIDVTKLGDWKSIWTLGIIADIEVYIGRPTSKIAGQKFYWVFFEDETFRGSFYVFPTDKRFKKMEKDILYCYENHLPFLLYVQRDLKFKEGDVNFKQVSISIDKQTAWGDQLIRMPFKFKKG